MPPFRHLHLLPFTESIQSEIQKPLRFVFPLGNHPDNVFVQSFRYEFLLHVRHKTLFIFGFRNVVQQFLFFIYIHNSKL